MKQKKGNKWGETKDMMIKGLNYKDNERENRKHSEKEKVESRKGEIYIESDKICTNKKMH